MATLSSMVGAIFRKAWRRYGQPVMTVVGPVTGWNLPAGFAYNQNWDAIKDSAGTVLTNVEDYWTTDTVYIVPTGGTPDLGVLVAAGIVPAGTVDVFILASDVTTVRAAHAVQIDGSWFDVQDVENAPSGISASGVWARVRLTRRS